MSNSKDDVVHPSLVPPLDTKREYYSDWVFRVLQILDAKECADAVKAKQPVAVAGVDPGTLASAQAEYDAMDRKARGIFTLFLGLFALNIAKKYPNGAYNMWHALQNEYQSTSASNQTNLLTKLLTTKMSENGNLEEHLSFLENTVSDLRAAGVEGVADEQLVAM